MVEERSLEAWFALEMARFHRALVARPRPLVELLAEREPSAPTKGGERHRFDPDALRSIDAALSPLARRRLHLPVTFYVDKDLPHDASVADEGAMDLLRALGAVDPGAAARDGRLWLGLARARLLSDRYPGVFQFVHT